MGPEFLAGSEHIAHCPVTNPTAKQWTYDAELYLVKDETKYTTSGTVSFTLAAGVSATVDFPITMPDSEGTYDVYLDVYVAGELIAAYQATEPVIVAPGFELIQDPGLSTSPPGVSLPAVKDYDCFAGAELSVYASVRNNYFPVVVTVAYEFSLIKGGQAIPIGSCSRTIPEGHSLGGVGIYITLPDMPGTYETMLRIYTNGVLTGQYPYLGPMTVIPEGVSHFSYTKPSLQIKWDTWWPGYTYGVTATITNTGSATEQKKVVLWLRRNYGACDYANQWYRKHEFTLSLAPGESYSYSHLPKHDVSDPDWDYLGMVGGENFLAQLRDSDSGVSAKSNTVLAD